MFQFHAMIPLAGQFNAVCCLDDLFEYKFVHYTPSLQHLLYYKFASGYR